MIKYLNRIKCKKGFTMVELVVVIIIIGILAAIMTTSLIGGNTEKILSANSNAESFFSAAQLAFTRAQLTERELVNYKSTEPKLIKYKDGVNQILDDLGNAKYMFVEAKFQERGIEWLHLDYTLPGLMSKLEDDEMTKLEQYFASGIGSGLNESYDGYFYAVVDNNFKVLFTHFCAVRLPTYSGDKTTFRDSMMISDGKVTGSGTAKGNMMILGSCSDVYTVPETGEYAFALPSPTGTDPTKDMYFG